MIKPELFDTVELIFSLPEHDLQCGAKAAIVEQYDEDNFELEFVNEDGSTEALITLSAQNFIVVWKNATKKPVSTAERITQLIPRLPQPQIETVLEFTQFLATRNYQPQAISAN